jgi:hypothetical protein
MSEMEFIEFSDKKIVGAYEKPLTESDVDAIISTALEGGIGYWARLDTSTPGWEDKPDNNFTSEWVTKMLLEGREVKFEDAEDEEEDCSEWVLTLEKLIKGINLNTKNRDWDCDIDNGDATTMDCIIQYALFGEVVYG